MPEEGGFTFEPSSYDQGSARIHQAGADLDLAGDGYQAVQGRASEQLRQWMPTVPAAATLDQIETKLAEATRLGAADLHQTSDKLLTAKTNLEEAEAVHGSPPPTEPPRPSANPP